MAEAYGSTCVLGRETDDECPKHTWNLLSTATR